MQRIGLIIGLAILIAGCATPGSMRNEKPVISGDSEKSVVDLAACISDKWSEKYSTVSMLPRQNGVAVQIGNLVAGLDSLIDVEAFSHGSRYKYFERMPSLTPAFNSDAVRNCE